MLERLRAAQRQVNLSVDIVVLQRYVWGPRCFGDQAEFFVAAAMVFGVASYIRASQ